jgi:hypothetical protein
MPVRQNNGGEVIMRMKRDKRSPHYNMGERWRETMKKVKGA